VVVFGFGFAVHLLVAAFGSCFVVVLLHLLMVVLDGFFFFAELYLVI